MNNSSSHITNTNKALKNIKLDVMADFICIKNKGVIIIVMGIQTLTIFILFSFIFSDFTFLFLYLIFLERR